MKLGRLNHIGVATPSIVESIAYYRDVMGASDITEPFDLPEQGVRVCFVNTPTESGMNGTQIELIEPYDESSPINGFLAKNPAGGQHHLCRQLLPGQRRQLFRRHLSHSQWLVPDLCRRRRSAGAR